MSDIRRAVAMAHQRPPVSLSVREAMLTLILGQLVEHSRVQASTAQPIAGEFQQLIRWMTSKLHEQVTIKEMAEFTGYSASHFRSRFVKEVGCPPGNFLRHVRHMEAGRLLRETQKPIKTIALQVGYEDPSHFYRFFTGLSGLTPLAYRERYQLRG